jgi:hypothetical protein
MTPAVHTTITYGMDTGTIYALIALGWMGMMAMMLYSEKPSGCRDEDNSTVIRDSSSYFKSNELVSTDDFSDNMDSFMDKLHRNELEKIGILTNDTISIVAMPHAHYQKLLDCCKRYGQEEGFNEDTANTHRK